MDRGVSAVGVDAVEGNSYLGKSGTDSFSWIAAIFFFSTGSGLYATDVAAADFSRCAVGAELDLDVGCLPEPDGSVVWLLFSYVLEIGLGTVRGTAVLWSDAVEECLVGECDADSLCTPETDDERTVAFETLREPLEQDEVLLARAFRLFLIL